MTGSLDTPGSIGNIGLSPNGQFLLVEVNPEGSPLGYQGLTADEISQGTVVRVLDLQDNTVVGGVSGIRVRPGDSSGCPGLSNGLFLTLGAVFDISQSILTF